MQITFPAEALALAGCILMPLYTRISATGALGHETRSRLYAQLRERPGQSRRELCQATGVHPMTLLHHLHVLCSLGLVVAHREGREVLYATREAPARVPAPLRAKPRQDVARTLLSGPATQMEISRATGLSQRLVAYHLARMSDLVEGDGRRPRRYVLRDPALVAEL